MKKNDTMIYSTLAKVEFYDEFHLQPLIFLENLLWISQGLQWQYA